MDDVTQRADPGTEAGLFLPTTTARRRTVAAGRAVSGSSPTGRELPSILSSVWPLFFKCFDWLQSFHDAPARSGSSNLLQLFPAAQAHKDTNSSSAVGRHCLQRGGGTAGGRRGGWIIGCAMDHGACPVFRRIVAIVSPFIGGG